MKYLDKKERLVKFAEELKAHGFKVYMVDAITCDPYAHFVKDGKIGYMDCGNWGFNFTTVHKPCRECGTGYSMGRDCLPSLEMAEASLRFAPGWAFPGDVAAIKKYNDWEDYQKRNAWQTWKEL